MSENQYGDLIERWKVELVRARARRLGFPKDEIPDLEQTLVWELLHTCYQPGREGGAAEVTFVTTVIDRHLKNLKRDRSRDRRRAGYEAQSLDDDPVAAEEASCAPRVVSDPGMRLDVEQALAGLTPAERSICEALMQGHSQADIARASGCTRAAVSKRVNKIAVKLRRWGLDDYLPTPKKHG